MLGCIALETIHRDRIHLLTRETYRLGGERSWMFEWCESDITRNTVLCRLDAIVVSCIEANGLSFS